MHSLKNKFLPIFLLSITTLIAFGNKAPSNYLAYFYAEKAKAIVDYDADKAKIYLDSCLIELLKNYDAFTEGVYNIELAKVNRKLFNYNDAQNAAMLAKQYFYKTKNALYLADAQYQLGTIYLYYNKFNEALTEFKQSSYLYDSLNVYSEYIAVQNAIGSCFYQIGQHKIAEEYFNTVYQYAQKNNDSLMLYYSLNNLAAVMQSTEQLKAIGYYKKALEINKSIGLNDGISGILMNIGVVYGFVNNNDSAIKYTLQALSYAKQNLDTVELIMVYVNLSQFYNDLQKYNKSIACADTAIYLSKAVNNYLYLPDLYWLKSQNYAAVGNYKQAYNILELASDVKDSIWNDNLAENLKLLNDSFATERELKQKALEKALLESEMSKYKVTKAKYFALGVTFVFMFLIVITIIIYSRKLAIKNRDLNHKNSVIKLRNSKLSDTVKSRDKLISIIAHDIKNPLSTIIGFSELIQQNIQTNDTSRVGLFASEIYKSTILLNTLLDNLLFWAKSQKDSIVLYPETLNIYNIVDDNFRLYSVMANEKEIDLVNDCNISDNILADYSTINTVVRNLINNAIKFTGNQGFVSVSTSKNNGLVEIQIKDNGCGMNSDEVLDLFNNKKIVQNNKKPNSGTGLGLLLCSEFVKNNSGKISVSSEKNIGTTFIITLPAAV